MAAVAIETDKYQEQPALPFSSTELAAFHRFHAYNWDEDDQFQAGLRTITETQGSTPSFSELLKMRQYYFSTRLGTRISLDDYIAWRKHLEKPSDDPNVPIFKRFDEYDFDNDARFQQGLPSIIGQLMKDGKTTLDKASLQKEMTKAKAFYYARFIELFDFAAYLTWKDMEKSQAGPACPFAHLWQNKGKGSSNDLEEDAQTFLTTTRPISSGALQLHLHSPATKNVLTSRRLSKISQAISTVSKEGSITSIYWTANSGKSSRDQRDPESEITSKDEKWFSGGLVVTGSSVPLTTQDPSRTKELLRQYYSLVDQISETSSKDQKPVIIVVDGVVSLSAAYLAYGSGAVRVITEDATLAFARVDSIQATPNEVANPFAGLYLLSRAQAKAISDTGARPVPKGVGHYLAFCPDYILRGPDLRKLGLADFFVSSSKKNDIQESILSVAGCPPPHTAQAVCMALNAEVVYPGPAKIDVWRDEIKECFGEAGSLKDIVTNLEKYDKPWSKSIRDYIASLEPVFAKLMFEAIKRASELSSFQECARLEYRLAQHYRDYLSSSSEKKQEAEEDLESFFKPIEGEEAELFSFPFDEWLKEHQQDDDEFDSNAAVSETDGQDPTKACPYLASKSGSSNTIPSDHPNIPGVDFSDPEAAKSCPFLSSKKQNESVTQPEAVPSDHPKIPGVDMSDPEATKSCPFLSAKAKKEQESSSNGASSIPADHPKIPGVDMSDPEAAKS
ncbi:Enoyl-CoA hydratase EchA9, partial [Mortierella sp. GBA43]